MTSTFAIKEMQSREMNIVEMLFHFLWFACGFIPGYLVAQQSGLMPGLIVGFFAFLLTLFGVGRLQMAFKRKHSRRGSKNKSHNQ